MSEKLKEIIEGVKPRLRPSSDEVERGKRVYSLIESRLKEAFRDYGFEITLQGSFAKGTALSGDLDLDVFVLIPKEYGKKWIKENFISIALEAVRDLNPGVRYAEHPYIRVSVDGVEADIVPALKVSRGSEAETATDRTPYHTEFVLRHMDETLRDEVRLLKRFMKVANVYGAEVRVGGFSGYLVELLIIRYGSFIRVVEDAAYRWRVPVEIYLEGYSDAMEDIKNIYRDSAMFFPDPVDPKRNVAAAVSKKTLSKFIVASKLFLDDPSESYFFPGEPRLDVGSIERIYCNGHQCTCPVGVVVRLNSGESPDNIWGEIKRIARRLYRSLESEGYEPLRYGFFWDELGDLGLVYVEFRSCVFRDRKIVTGPPAHARDSLKFIKKQLSGGYGFWIDDSGRVKGYRSWRYGSVTDLIEAKKHLFTGKNIYGVARVVTGIRDLAELFEDKSYREWLIEEVLGIPRYLWGRFQQKPM